MNRPYHLDAEAIARRLNPSARRSPSGWWALPGICHDRRDRPHLGVRDNRGRDGSDVVSVKCWAGCDRDSVRRAIEGATGWRSGDSESMTPLPHVPRLPPRTGRHRETAPSTPPALGGVPSASSRPGPPVRRWVAREACTGPLPFPYPPVFAGCRQDCSAAAPGRGAIVAAFAPTDEWAERWPYLPGPTCIELVHLDAEGLPALDKPAEEGGLGKRSYGIRQGAVCLLGDPRPESAVGLVIVEGLATRWRWRPGPLRPRLPSVGSADSRRTGSWTGCPAGRVLRSTPTTTLTA